MVEGRRDLSTAPDARPLPRLPAAVAAVLFVSLSLHLPLSLFTVAGHDDALYWRLAESITRTGWLGAYDELTLAKGPGFSFLLALNHWLGTPITLLLALMQLACAFVLVRELRAWDMGRLLALTTWLVLVFQPAGLPARVMRDFLYQPLTLLVVAGLLFLARRSHRGNASFAAAAFGIAAGMLWITREEGVWVVPAALLLLTGFVKVHWRDRDELWQFGRRIGVYGGACLLTVGIVSSVNLLRYGTFSVVDLKNAPFVETLRLLNGIQTSNPIAYVPVNRQQRELAYAVSPAFSELQGYLERDDLHWKKHGCELYRQTCGDHAGGWFLWAVREAAAEAGHFASAAHADRFFGRIAAEIGDACRSGRLRCSTHGLPFLPRMTADAWDRLLPATVRAVSVSLYGEGLDMNRPESHGPTDRFLAFREFLGWPRVVPIERRLRISGWFVGAADEWIELVCGDGGQSRVLEITRQPSPDLVRALDRPQATQSRFKLDVATTTASNCALRVIGAPESSVRVAELRSRSSGDLGSGSRAYIDEVSSGEEKPVATRIAQSLVKGYAALAPWIMGAALAVGVWASVAAIRSRRWPPMLVAGAVCWTLAATRILLLALVDATSFPGIIIPYLAPATQLWWVGALCLLSIPFGRTKGARARAA